MSRDISKSDRHPWKCPTLPWRVAVWVWKKKDEKKGNGVRKKVVNAKTHSRMRIATTKKPISVYPIMSTGLWDGAFQVVCKYRSDGERIKIITSAWSRVHVWRSIAPLDEKNIERLQEQNTQTHTQRERIHTSRRGWTKWSDSIFNNSILGSSATFGFSNTMCSVDEEEEADCACPFWRCGCARIIDDGENASTPPPPPLLASSSKDDSSVNILIVRKAACLCLFGRTNKMNDHWRPSAFCVLCFLFRCLLVGGQGRRLQEGLTDSTKFYIRIDLSVLPYCLNLNFKLSK